MDAQKTQQIISLAKQAGIPDDYTQRKLMEMMASEQQSAPTINTPTPEKPNWLRSLVQTAISPFVKTAKLVGEAGYGLGYKLSGAESRGELYKSPFNTEAEMQPFARQEGETSDINRIGRGMLQAGKNAAGVLSYAVPGGGGAATTAGGKVLTAAGRGALSGGLFGFGTEKSPDLVRSIESAGVGAIGGAATGGVIQGISNILGKGGSKAITQATAGQADDKAYSMMGKNLHLETPKRSNGFQLKKQAEIDISKIITGAGEKVSKEGYGKTYEKLLKEYIDLVDNNPTIVDPTKIKEKWLSSIPSYLKTSKTASVLDTLAEGSYYLDDVLTKNPDTKTLSFLNHQLNSKLGGVYNKLDKARDILDSEQIIKTLRDTFNGELRDQVAGAGQYLDNLSLLNEWAPDVMKAKGANLWLSSIGARANFEKPVAATRQKIGESMLKKAGAPVKTTTPNVMVPEIPALTFADKAAGAIGNVTGKVGSKLQGVPSYVAPRVGAIEALKEPELQTETVDPNQQVYDLISGLVPPSTEQFGTTPQLTPQKLGLIQAMAAQPKYASQLKDIYEIMYGSLEQKEEKPLSVNAANSKSGLSALSSLKELYNKNPDLLYEKLNPIYFLKSSEGKQYQTYADEIKDVLQRLRTGAAISNTEHSFYEGKLPQPFDPAEVVAGKLKLFEDLFSTIYNRDTGTNSLTVPNTPSELNLEI